MRRREFVSLVAGAVLGAPVVARGQSSGKVHRVGLIFGTAPVSTLVGPDPDNSLAGAFVQALSALGYTEGQNLVLERRSAEGRLERSGEIAADLIRDKVDVIVTAGNETAEGVKRATSTVPIVMATSFDPVGAGFVASLARPGGNVTGFTVNIGPEIEAKRLQLLKEALPDAKKIAFLGMQREWNGPEGDHVRAAAVLLGITLLHAEHTPTDYAGAFALIVRDRPHAIFVARHGAIFPHRQLIADFAVEHRMPGIYPFREIVEAGGLMSYGANVADLFRRAAGYVDKILKGARPADLPVEQPTRFELLINLKTAKALGIETPATLLTRADEVIE